MNFAFPALVILVLSLPGIFLRFGYRQGLNEANLTFGGLAEEIANGLILALLIHLSIAPLLPYIPGALPVKFEIIITLMSGATTDPAFQAACGNVGEHFYRIAIYILFTSALGTSLGMIGHHVIRKYHWDIVSPGIRSSIFRFPNAWDYLFTGRLNAYFDIKNLPRRAMRSELIERLKPEIVCRISVLVEVEGKAMVIFGWYMDHRLNQKGDLDRIILKDVSRISLPEQPVDISDIDAIRSNPNLKYFRIKGDQFLIPYSEVKNLNLEFFTSDFKRVPSSSVPVALTSDKEKQPT